ncbi:MAG: hypothetical protein IJ324_04380 [Lachnospiraceae bacterium]|nr:hypothetical protein [Lachnospiraceae bacterium]
MKFYHITEEPIKIYGLAVMDREKRQFWRVTPEIMEALPQYEFLGKRAVPLSGSAGADIYVGKGKEATFLGYIAPKEHMMEEVTVEKMFVKRAEMDADFYNFGFSGSARGEMEFAEYIAALPEIGLFVYDYDHNAPTSGHLEQTHERFFQRVRQAHPDVPIIMLSRPDTDGDEGSVGGD